MLQGSFGVEALAVVADAYAELVGVPIKADIDIHGLRVFQAVVETFLDDAEEDELFVVADGAFARLSDLSSLSTIRVASEYPSIAEAFALASRLPVYRVQPVWGSAEGYPPEDADIVVVAASDEAALSTQGLRPLHQILESSTWLVANRDSLSGGEMAAALSHLLPLGKAVVSNGLKLPEPLVAPGARNENAA